ncbi:MAG: symporter small accessory protein [Candidatus Methanomethylophilaceae archaeon]|jgi:hypothetical protein
MLGLTDPWIWSAYIGCFAAVAFCIIYGYFKGNKAEEVEEDE